jgi:dienelactone hydrolase
MRNLSCLTLFFIALLHSTVQAQPDQLPDSPWGLKALFQTPQTHPATCCAIPGMKALFYEGTEYKSRPTKVFAYYKAPAGTPPAGGWPAVVCVHGGGGTAFPGWVQAWVDRGYAAIAMDVEGHLPIGDFPNRQWHADGGPPRITTFGDIEIADREQWFYHAVADVIRANSLLRSFPEINKAKIGLHGISWGGVITSAVIGLDNRFAFAIPIYGCGYLYETTDPGFGKYFKVMTAGQMEAYKSKWDPSLYIPHAKMPVLWYNGSNDGAFPLDIWQKSALLVSKQRYLSIPVTSEHGHIWNQPEVFAFADMVVKGGQPLLEIGQAVLVKNKASVQVAGKATIAQAVLCYTTDTGDWQKRKWLQVPAEIQKISVSAAIPAGATAFYFNITDDCKLNLSTPYVEIKAP